MRRNNRLKINCILIEIWISCLSFDLLKNIIKSPKSNNLSIMIKNILIWICISFRLNNFFNLIISVFFFNRIKIRCGWDVFYSTGCNYNIFLILSSAWFFQRGTLTFRQPLPVTPGGARARNTLFVALCPFYRYTVSVLDVGGTYNGNRDSPQTVYRSSRYVLIFMPRLSFFFTYEAPQKCHREMREVQNRECLIDFFDF